MGTGRPTVDDPIETIMSAPPKYVSANATLRDISVLLYENNIGSLLVQSDHGAPSIVSERDIVREMAQGADPDLVWSEEISSSPLLTVDVSEPIVEVAERLIGFGIRHVAITRHGKVVGIVSARDVFEVLAGRLFDHLYHSIPITA